MQQPPAMPEWVLSFLMYLARPVGFAVE